MTIAMTVFALITSFVARGVYRRELHRYRRREFHMYMHQNWALGHRVGMEAYWHDEDCPKSTSLKGSFDPSKPKHVRAHMTDWSGQVAFANGKRDGWMQAAVEMGLAEFEAHLKAA